MASQLFIGLMSGTSLDGVDVALVTFNHLQHPQLLKTHFVAYSPTLRAQILALQHPTDNELETTALIGNTLARLYATAVNELLSAAKIDAKSVTAIGCHGQTIRHRPELGFTMQIGNAALLSELTGITVISDFRSRDIAAGGQGAPLVPAFHQDVFAHKKHNRAIINIGGIANITYLSSSGAIFGFDSGPGNMLLDAWIKQHLGLDYDADGQWSSTGRIIEPLLDAMLSEPYFSAPPPKSTGRDLFNDAWLNHWLTTQQYAPNDVARTLVALSALSIANAINQYCREIDEIYLCGGGAKNKLLASDLQSLMGQVRLESTDKLGMGVDWVEAIAFAWLAKKCLSQESANLPEVTGAKGLRILGAIYQA
ncbi:anhydro-N-acetylmuramic acid kinase [Methylotenera sp. L2L1]|uniref:anhydro-N-acetylmuramic acid kinase n=1 Tax=Methylotenera sp. L2L1 TaxID=1502770 RepID=UPI000567BC77|nr:anhydro-N-acetylmuramic acid kinase [Methylotenera sp. L2L1]